MQEAKLIQLRFQEGSEEISFPQLYRNHKDLVRAVLFRICGGRELDDLVQEAFIKLWRGLRSFRGGSTLKTWVYRVTVNVAFDYLRKNRPTFEEHHTDDLPNRDSATSPEYKDLVTKGLLGLSAEHRAVLVLNVFEGLTMEEMSNVLDISVGTVKSRLFHARKNILLFFESQGVKI